MLTLPAAPLASNTYYISNTLTYLYTASVIFKVFAVNKYKKLFAPPPLRPLKPNQYTKLIKITQIICIKQPIGRSQYMQFQNKEIKEVKEVILYQVLKDYSYYRHYYNKTKKEVKVKKECKRDKLYAKQERNIKKLKGLNLKIPLDLERFNLGPYNLNFIN